MIVVLNTDCERTESYSWQTEEPTPTATEGPITYKVIKYASQAWEIIEEIIDKMFPRNKPPKITYNGQKATPMPTTEKRILTTRQFMNYKTYKRYLFYGFGLWFN